MFNDASTGTFKKVYIACGKTDLRRGIDGLASIIKLEFRLEPCDKGTLFLFCGTRRDRCKGLVWEGDGWLLLYKRLSNGAFCWPRNSDELKDLTQEQYQQLMSGFTIEGTIRESRPKYIG